MKNSLFKTFCFHEPTYYDENGEEQPAYFHSLPALFVGQVKATRAGVVKAMPWGYGVSTPYRFTEKQCLSVTPCHYPHWRPVFGPSCTEFVYPGCWHFDDDITSKIDDVLTEHDGLLHGLPLSVLLRFVLLDK